MRTTIIANDNSELCLGIVVEYNPDKINNPIQAMRDIAKDYIQKHNIPDTKPFNWGDLVEIQDNENIFQQHGIKIIDSFVTEFVVNHNEDLHQT